MRGCAIKISANRSRRDLAQLTSPVSGGRPSCPRLGRDGQRGEGRSEAAFAGIPPPTLVPWPQRATDCPEYRHVRSEPGRRCGERHNETNLVRVSLTWYGSRSEGRATIDGDWAGRVTGVRGQRVEIAMMRMPDGHGRIELSRF